MNCFADACKCKDFGLIISLKKMQVMGQDVKHPPSTSIEDYKLAAIQEFVYLGSTISNSLSLETKINSTSGKPPIRSPN